MVECLDGAGDLKQPCCSFVPWGAKGLSLDLMRRDRDAENGLVEFMVISLINDAQSQDSTLGLERVSLNFAMFRSIFDRAGRLGAGPPSCGWPAWSCPSSPAGGSWSPCTGPT